MKVLENFKYGENEMQIMDVHIPEGVDEFPVFVNFHGGGLKNGRHTQIFVPDLCKIPQHSEDDLEHTKEMFKICTGYSAEQIKDDKND